ncbi:hypothetical protein GLW08_11280 [Pontibacillus yanchengensis]|uniref:Uncharacterized protein n=2 Tax=Pontibacillus yanchengensis TaxID=462910 RepID=A0ACC7VIZ7_9BACI|nr:hypothetical protein [Pontibacillus yanchengensis]MYL33894.1 hypothetical protein [Pontibacillus yanchengensis]MYL53919.1 hypothetical protein [Pontibacillus yanchengensis]
MNVLEIDDQEEVTATQLQDAARDEMAIQCTLQKAVMIVREHLSVRETNVTFLLTDSWTARPECHHVTELLITEKIGEARMGRIMERIHPVAHKTGAHSDVFYAYMRQLSFSMSCFGHIKRIHGMRTEREVEGYDHMLSTIRFENGAMAQVEISSTKGLKPIYEIDISGTQGNVHYRNEPTASFQIEMEDDTSTQVDPKEVSTETADLQRITFMELFQLMKLTEQAFQSATTGLSQEV